MKTLFALTVMEYTSFLMTMKEDKLQQITINQLELITIMADMMDDFPVTYTVIIIELHQLIAGAI